MEGPRYLPALLTTRPLKTAKIETDRDDTCGGFCALDDPRAIRSFSVQTIHCSWPASIMKSCSHSYWFSLGVRGNEVSLTSSDRPQNLLSDLPRADRQQPSLIVLLGRDEKALALQELVLTKSESRRSAKRGYGETHLHLDPSTAFSDRPVLFADGNFTTHIRPSKAVANEGCHDVNTRCLPILRNSILTDLYEAADQVYARLLTPFTDVFCIFASDLGGLELAAARLASWLTKGSPSSLPPSTRPHIIIVESTLSQEKEPQRLETFLNLLKQKTKHDSSLLFGTIRVVSLLPDGAVSGLARYRRLRECIMDASDQVRSARRASSYLFTASHFFALLDYSCNHLSMTLTEPFNVIRASRTHNPPASDMSEHFVNLLSKMKDPNGLRNFAIPLMASSILLDSYPPDMHLFDPLEVFRTLYRDACYSACRAGLFKEQDSKYLALQSGVVKMVEDRLVEMFEVLSCGETTAVELHRKLLATFDAEALSIRSNVTCLVCVRRHLQNNILSCGHGVCQFCVRAFSTNGAVVKDRPPTAGIRLLTFDGGGVRVLIGLQNLLLVEERVEKIVGQKLPVQENFDLIVGPSAGGIAAIDLVNGSTVAESIENFERSATFAFQPRPSSNIPILSSLMDFILWIFNDGRYSGENMDIALQRELGTKTLYDYSRATATGTKLCILVTTIWDASTCVFTNYNATGTRPHDCVQGVALQHHPKEVADLGAFQDGGLEHNNPLSLALEEASAIDPFAAEPGLVVSLGTGSSKVPDSGPRMLFTRGILKDGWIPRLLRAFKSTIGATYSPYQRRGSKDKYFRFDEEFDGPEPQLDDTSKMQELKAAARSSIEGSVQHDRLARCIIAELFFFELDFLPVKKKGQYACTGKILCRLSAGDPSLGVLSEQLNRSLIKFLLQDRLIPNSKPSYLATDGNFCLAAEFEVDSRKSKVSLYIQEGSSEPCSISGSPFSINGLIAAQQLEAPFGRADHAKRQRPESTETHSRKRQRI
ncbi:hypothetical protein V493_00121 [Pseudogymnoascus sp. VKM F-4281 (FW-2241)]|nr:hypothetical protein V493_00121 [Pseudogymnoascus sp. VKM F-4281 (FW-2241)]